MFAIPVIVKWFALVAAGVGLGKVTDDYVKPLLPSQVQYEGALAPRPIMSVRTIWIVAVGVIAAMLVVWVGKTLNIQFLKRKI